MIRLRQRTTSRPRSTQLKNSKATRGQATLRTNRKVSEPISTRLRVVGDGLCWDRCRPFVLPQIKDKDFEGVAGRPGPRRSISPA